MIKRNMKRVMAVVMAAAMVMQQGSFVKAQEPSDDSSFAASAPDTTDSAAPDASTESSSEAGTDEAGSGAGASTETQTDSGSGSLSGDEAGREDSAEDEASLEDSEETAADTASTEASIEEAEEGKELPEGINGMPETFSLSKAQSALKAKAVSHGVMTTFASLTAGEDYVDSQIIALADTREDAEAIAYAYSGELIEYSYGLATISLSDSVLSVSDALTYSLDESLELPFVSPNYLSSLIEPAEEESTSYAGGSSLFAAGTEVPADNGYADRWWIDNIREPYLDPGGFNYQWFHEMINTYSAWGVTTGDPSITVAILDTGIRETHNDLRDNIDNDHIIEVKTGIGRTDNAGHGTHVAGIVAAEINDVLGAGVAPGVTILPVKVYRDDKGDIPDNYAIPAIAAVAGLSLVDGHYVVNEGARIADVINMSFGGNYYNPMFEEVIRVAAEAGVTMVAAMGNDKVSNQMNYPAAYDHVIGVCSVDESGSLSNFSTYGSWADISAPGSNIYSCYRSSDNAYYKDEGTSMACPVVSGACALYMSAVGHVDPDTMERVLKASVTGSAGSGTGSGILDLAKLFKGDVTAPKITLTANDAENTMVGSVQDGSTYNVPYDAASDSKLSFTPMNFGGNAAGNTHTKIVYTTDGKAPSVFNGDVLSGTAVYDSDVITVSDLTGEISERTKVTVKAAAVTGMGVMGKVSTLTFWVDPSLTTKSEALSDTVTLNITNAPDKLVAGKGYKLEAKVTSSDDTKAVSQQVVWRIESYSGGDLSGAKIGASTGALTTVTGKTGRLIISCTTADARATDSVTIEITKDYPVQTMALSAADTNLGFDYSASPALGESTTVSVSKLTDTEGHDLLTDTTYSVSSKTFRWTSSNPSVVSVVDETTTGGDYDTTVKAVGVGSAIITGTVLDGSGKKAQINIKVSADADKKVFEIRLYEGTVISETSHSVTTETVFAGSGAFDIIARQFCIDGGRDYLDPVWQSSNSKIVKVETDPADGKIVSLTPLNKGVATVTCVAADGSGKKAVLRVSVLQPVTSITVTGQSYIASGSSGKYTATALPTTANNRKVTWEFANPDDPDDLETIATYDDISINATNGTVTVNSGIYLNERVCVRAVAADGSQSYGYTFFYVHDKAASVVAAIDTEGSESGIHYSDVIATSKRGSYLNTTKITAKACDSEGNDLGTLVSFTSSNPKVATVSCTNNVATVNAVGKGVATITATAQDGSGKKASVKVTVLQLVSSVTVTGQSNIAIGNKAAYKAAVLPATANNKKITWRVVDAATGAAPAGVTVSNGNVTVTGEAVIGTTVQVWAIPEDTGIPSQTCVCQTFTVTSVKTTNVNIVPDEDSVMSVVHIPAMNKGSLSSFRLYDMKITDSLGCNENNIVLGAEISNVTKDGTTDLTSAVKVQWTSANTKVAKVIENNDGTATIQGVKAGTTTISCQALDGSNKKATAKVTVITPASDITIVGGNTLKENGDNYALGKGVATTIKAPLGTAYGKPTVSAVNWRYKTGFGSGVVFKDIATYVMDELEDAGYSAEEAMQLGMECEQFCIKNKYFFTFNNGKLTVANATAIANAISKIESLYGVTLPENTLTARVTATSTDGTERADTRYFTVVEPTTWVRTSYKDPSDPEAGYVSYSSYIVPAEIIGHESFVPLRVESDVQDSYPNALYSVNSSNPSVVTAFAAYDNSNNDGKKVFLHVIPHGKGTAKLTITALDGTGKKCVITIKVQEVDD